MASDLCNKCGKAKEPTRAKSNLCRACDSKPLGPLCAKCKGPKESTRQNSRMCRACDGGGGRVTATLTPDAYAALVAAATAAGRTPDEHLTVLALGKFAPKT